MSLLKAILLCACAVLLLTSVNPTSAWANNSFGYRVNVTLNTTDVLQTLSNFTILVQMNTTNVNYANMQASCNDVMFAGADDNTVLPYDRDTCNTAGNSSFWVKVPTLNATSTNQKVYMYYGCPGCSDMSNAMNAWDANYTFVMHAQNGTNVLATEVTSNFNNTAINVTANTSGYIGSSYSVSLGVTGLGYLYNDTASPRANPTTGPGTIEAWMRKTSDPNSNVAVDIGGGGTILHELLLRGNGVVRASSGGQNLDSSLNVCPVSTWCYGASIITNATMRAVFTNAVYNTSTILSTTGTPGTMSIGARRTGAAGSNGFNGSLDEIRYSNTNRSIHWLNATYFTSSGAMQSYAAIDNAPSGGNSCTYTSGTWVIACSDACVLSSNVNLGNNPILFNGVGTVTIAANIVGWTYAAIQNSCVVVVTGGRLG